MPKTNVYELRKNGANVRKCSNHLRRQTAAILPEEETTGFLARATEGSAAKDAGKEFREAGRAEESKVNSSFLLSDEH
jgi:hypothetical protein